MPELLYICHYDAGDVWVRVAVKVIPWLQNSADS